MAIEAIKTGVTYQGSTAQTESKSSVSNTAGVSAAAERTEQNGTGSSPAVADETAEHDGKVEQEEKQTTGSKQIRKAIDEINKKAVNSEAIFGIHDKTNRVMIKIIDKDTKKVIKEYPPEKTLDMIAKVWEMAGLMVDEKM